MQNGPDLQALFERNARWAAERTAQDPDYFAGRAKEHKPRYLWIGCSDSRVPVEQLTQTEPGEVFVLRNVANQVMPTDVSFQAALQYALDALGVEDVVVCGHSACGGVKASLSGGAPAVVDHWLGPLRTVVRLHERELAELPEPERVDRLVELNVREQVRNLTAMPAVQAAWARGQRLRLHGWVYDLSSGRLRDVGVTVDGSTTDSLAGAGVG